MIVCSHCDRHHSEGSDRCPHCARHPTGRVLTRGAIFLGLALASGGCDGGNDKAVALYGAPYYPDTGDTGDTAEDPEDDQA